MDSSSEQVTTEQVLEVTVPEHPYLTFNQMIRFLRDLDSILVRSMISKYRSLEEQVPLRLTSDVMIFHENRILLIKRRWDPFGGHWAFPGGHVDHVDLDLEAAALRELREETGLVVPGVVYVCTVGNRSRDPRGFYITNVFTCTIDDDQLGTIHADDDASEAVWFLLDDLPEMAFDHREILDEYLARPPMEIDSDEDSG